MKKLMVFAVAAVAAMVSFAEPSWAVVNTEGAHDGTAWEDKSGDTSRYTAYLCTVEAAKTYFGGKTTVEGITAYLEKGGENYAKGMESLMNNGTALDAYGYDEGEYSFTTYFQPGTLELSKYIAVLTYSGTDEQNNMFRVFENGMEDGNILFDPAASAGAAGEWTKAAGAVPEPTSGLLLLIGVAGLALRRRRA